MVELGEPVEEFLSDNGFGIKLYLPHLDERREIGYFFGIGLHLASVGRLPVPVTQSRANLTTRDGTKLAATRRSCASEISLPVLLAADAMLKRNDTDDENP
jgi:hypothetical protein